MVDAVSERDLEVVALACLQTEAGGKRLIYRTAASFAGIRGGIPLRSTLKPADMNSISQHGGLVVVGSYVQKSSEQLAALLESGNVQGLEVVVAEMLEAADLSSFIAPIVDKLTAILESGQNAALYTSRELVTGADERGNLLIGQKVSRCLVEITRSLPIVPRFIIAKGGITSSDLATDALSIKRARVVGQILPGDSGVAARCQQSLCGRRLCRIPRQRWGRDCSLARPQYTFSLKQRQRSAGSMAVAPEPPGSVPAFIRFDLVVGGLNFLETTFGFALVVFGDIGMVFARQLAEGVLDRFLPGADLNFQRQVRGVDLFRWNAIDLVCPFSLISESAGERAPR